MITAKMIGFDEVRRDLKKLSIKVQKQVLRKGMRKGAAVIAATAKGTTVFRDHSGRLRKSIKAKVARDKPGEVGARVVVEEWYGRLVEKGFVAKKAIGFERSAFKSKEDRNMFMGRVKTKAAVSRIKKKYRIGKHVGARPYLVPALAEKRSEVLKAIETDLKKTVAEKIGVQRYGSR